MKAFVLTLAVTSGEMWGACVVDVVVAVVRWIETAVVGVRAENRAASHSPCTVLVVALEGCFDQDQAYTR